MITYQNLLAVLTALTLSLGVGAQNFPPLLTDFVDPCEPTITDWDAFINQCALPDQELLFHPDFLSCQFPMDPAAPSMQSLPVLGNNDWMVLEPQPGLPCMPIIESNGQNSVTELQMLDVPFLGVPSQMQLELAFLGPFTEQAQLKLIALPQQGQPQELFVLPFLGGNDLIP